MCCIVNANVASNKSRNSVYYSSVSAEFSALCAYVLSNI